MSVVNCFNGLNLAENSLTEKLQSVAREKLRKERLFDACLRLNTTFSKQLSASSKTEDKFEVRYAV